MPFETQFAKDVFLDRYSMDKKESWSDTVDRVVTAIGYSQIRKHMEDRVFIPAGRYLNSCGRPVHMILNCLGFAAKDSREGWATLLHDATMALSMGGGIGINYGALRPKGTPIKGTGGIASGPIALMKMVDAAAFHIRAGGSRRSALLSLLPWDHKDIFDFIEAKHRSEEEKAHIKLMRELNNSDFYLPMSLTNTSVICDDEFFSALYNVNHPKHMLAMNVDFAIWKSAFTTADPGVLFGDRLTISNACSEARFEKSGDSCNLGTIFLPKIKSKDHMAEVVKHAVKFMIRGALYTNRPTDETRRVAREENRIGLGLGGITEWLISKRYGYEVPQELKELLEIYAEVSEKEAKKYAKKLGMNEPKAFRAIAPNGTISIIAETTSGIEPIFCKAYKRSWWKNGKHQEDTVVDPAVMRLLSKGIPESSIFDAYDLDFEQRVKFQADIQDYVDQAISSTVNMPAWGTEKNDDSTLGKYRHIIHKYASRLKGLTVYSDGSIDGQPLIRMDLQEALQKEETKVEQKEDVCKGGTVCGI